MEVARGQVHPDVRILHTVPILEGYAVVTVDMVHSNATDHVLEPPPNEEVVTLGEALHQRIQWKRSGIVVSSASQSGRASGAPPPRRSPPKKAASLPSPPPQKAAAPHSPPHPAASLPDPPTMSSPPESPKKKKREAKKKGSKKPQPEKSKAIVPAKKATDIAPVWTQENPKFKYGKPMMTVDELAKAGKECVELHNYYMQACRDSKAKSIVVQYSRKHFLTDQDNYFIVGFNDLYDLFNLDGLDVSLLRCFTL